MLHSRCARSSSGKQSTMHHGALYTMSCMSACINSTCICIDAARSSSGAPVP